MGERPNVIAIEPATSRRTDPWYSITGGVFHYHPCCAAGRNIEGPNRREGEGPTGAPRRECINCRRWERWDFR